MSRKYKFHNKSGIYFVSFATVGWVDVFVREEYAITIVASLNFCISHKGLRVHCWCIMPSHIHLIISAENNNLSDVLRDFKTFTSKALLEQIRENPQESRKEWMLGLMKKSDEPEGGKIKRQFWQNHNQPIELWSNHVFEQKIHYIHTNPVVAGFVNAEQDWRWSSAIDYCGREGLVKVVVIE
jgi:putative transposase